ncbi:probable amino acid permease 7 isoform X4 [Manihot esculenta]|uniref:probable amino acid permease 7 isoform X4 n=1 Tax=Manihot esculenta TaxID=3983 RepID=UPI001CC61585|nr:probable amino acid permease 7 isoform X4 [Manihot esculenta]
MGGEAQESPLLRSVSSSDESSGQALKRTGTIWTATAHVIAGVIGAGVLSLAWSMAQLGWIAGPLAMIVFASVTLVSAHLICDCYRFPDPESGPNRNRSFMEAVGFYLGKRSQQVCGIFAQESFYGCGIAYTITAATSVRAIQRSNCYHREGHDAVCKYGDTSFMLVFGIIQMVASQIPNFHDMEWLSILAAIMSFAYSFIGFGLGFAKVIENGRVEGSISGVPTVDVGDKLWLVFEALGDIAFAYPYSTILLEIQIFSQPVFALVEGWLANRYPRSWFVNKPYTLKLPLFPPLHVNPLRLCFRTAYVASTTTIAMAFPYFNQVLGVLGALNFWPLAIYFPVEMYFVQKNIGAWTRKWIVLKMFSLLCFLFTIMGLIGSIQGLIKARFS